MSQARSATKGEGRGEAYYRRLLEEQEASGSSLRAFALDRGLSPWTLYGWRARLRRSGRSEPVRREGRLVAVDVVADPGSPAAIEVVLPQGVTVRFPQEVGAGRLVELVRALRSC
jgi:hypothetical protein